MRKFYSHRFGFALIDIIIYIALFAVLIGGVSVSAYNLFTSTNKNQTSTLVLEEGNFLLAKISWTIKQAKTITTPLPNASTSLLLLTPHDLSLGNSMLIQIQNKNMTLRRKNITNVLSNSNVEVSNLVFTHITSGNIESIESSFTLNSLAPNGTPVTTHFSSINFLHQ